MDDATGFQAPAAKSQMTSHPFSFTVIEWDGCDRNAFVVITTETSWDEVEVPHPCLAREFFMRNWTLAEIV